MTKPNLSCSLVGEYSFDLIKLLAAPPFSVDASSVHVIGSSLGGQVAAHLGHHARGRIGRDQHSSEMRKFLFGAVLQALGSTWLPSSVCVLGFERFGRLKQVLTKCRKKESQPSTPEIESRRAENRIKLKVG